MITLTFVLGDKCKKLATIQNHLSDQETLLAQGLFF